jgi:prepilin signal peptidase PulO-like enzyme (type II secretory pathway)
MSPDLSAACLMFVVPLSILCVALAVAATEQLKALLAAVMLGISILFAVRVWIWQGLLMLPDKYMALGLALIFLIAALISVFVLGPKWGRRHEAPPPKVGA